MMLMMVKISLGRSLQSLVQQCSDIPETLKKLKGQLFIIYTPVNKQPKKHEIMQAQYY